jgi:hypothetical protein
MTISYHEDDATRTAEIVVSGRITAEDYDKAITPMQSFIDRHKTVKLIEVIESFQGFDPWIIWDGIKFDMRNIPHISHVAVVSDIGWIGPMSKAAGALISTKLRIFELSQLDEAREWIKTA